LKHLDTSPRLENLILPNVHVQLQLGELEKLSRRQCYKTFYVRNWQIFVKKTRVLVRGKLFQYSLLFAGKARSLA
jgi:hypothetical protein